MRCRRIFTEPMEFGPTESGCAADVPFWDTPYLHPGGPDQRLGADFGLGRTIGHRRRFTFQEFPFELSTEFLNRKGFAPH